MNGSHLRAISQPPAPSPTGSSAVLRIVSPPRLEVRRSRACGLLRRGLTEHFLGRSEGHNPTRHAFEEFDLDGARAPARRADSAVRAGEPLGPLYGIPIAVKSPVCAEGFGLTTPMTGGGARMDPTNPGVFKPLHS